MICLVFRVQRPRRIFWESQQQFLQDGVPYNGWDPMLGIKSERKRMCCYSSIKGLTVLLQGQETMRLGFFSECCHTVLWEARHTGEKWVGKDLPQSPRESKKQVQWQTHRTDRPCTSLSIWLHLFILIPGGCRFVIQKYSCCCLGTPNPPRKHFLIVSRRNIVKSVYKTSYWYKLTFKTLYSLHFHL